MPDDVELKRLILEEGNKSRLSLYHDMTKMYQDLKETFWWQGMNRPVQSEKNYVEVSLSADIVITWVMYSGDKYECSQ